MLSDKIRLLDGGLASTLEAMGYDVDGDPLWSAKCLHSNPDSIKKVHTAFLNAGAEILITASYQASIGGFSSYLGLSKDEAICLIEKSVALAQEARNSFNKVCKRDIYIAGSVGPYGACKADGSEYSGSYMSSITDQELMDWHRPRIEALVTSGVDLLAIETMPALGEALVLLKLMKEYPNTNVWVSFSCKDNHFTNYGDAFGAAVKACYAENPDQLVGIGINCTNPSFITPLLTEAELSVPSTVLPRVVYPNSSEIWTSERRWIGDPKDFMKEVEKEAQAWISSGAKVIGGCCRVLPEHIEAIYKVIKKL